MAGLAPILVQEKLLLPSIGIAQEFISFKSVSFESEKFICVRENGAQPTVVSMYQWFADHFPCESVGLPLTLDNANAQ